MWLCVRVCAFVRVCVCFSARACAYAEGEEKKIKTTNRQEERMCVYLCICVFVYLCVCMYVCVVSFVFSFLGVHTRGSAEEGVCSTNTAIKMGGGRTTNSRQTASKDSRGRDSEAAQEGLVGRAGIARLFVAAWVDASPSWAESEHIKAVVRSTLLHL